MWPRFSKSPRLTESVKQRTIPTPARNAGSHFWKEKPGILRERMTNPRPSKWTISACNAIDLRNAFAAEEPYGAIQPRIVNNSSNPLPDKKAPNPQIPSTNGGSANFVHFARSKEVRSTQQSPRLFGTGPELTGNNFGRGLGDSFENTRTRKASLPTESAIDCMAACKMGNTPVGLSRQHCWKSSSLGNTRQRPGPGDGLIKCPDDY